MKTFVLRGLLVVGVAVFVATCGTSWINHEREEDRQAERAIRREREDARRVERTARETREQAKRAICRETCDAVDMETLRYWDDQQGLVCRCRWTDQFGHEIVVSRPDQNLQQLQRRPVEAVKGVVGQPAHAGGWPLMRDDTGRCSYCGSKRGHDAHCKIVDDVIRGHVDVEYR